MKLLIPVDGSDVALRAVAHALHLAHRGLATQLVLVNVQEPATVYEWVTLHDAEALSDLVQAAGQDLLAPAVALVQAAGVPHETLVLSGDVAPMLLEALEAEACEAVIMGSHGRGLVRSAWLGSVSQAMLERAPVPVTFVKPSEPDEEDDTMDEAGCAEGGADV